MDPVLLIFAGLAAFVIFRLISVLGSRQGHEQRHDIEGLQRAARGENRLEDSDGDSDGRPAGPTPLAPVSDGAKPLRASDPAFDEGVFLEGARAAYEMIIEAFAAGDLKSIRRFLNRSVYEAFKSAVVDREERGQVLELQFVGIERASIISSEANDDALIAVTEFASNQVRVTRDKEGEVVDGDPNRIDLVKDRWTFSRPRAGQDPNWTLVATGAAV